MAGWHHWLDGCESGWTPGVGDGQGGLVCCDSWGRKESDTTERLIWYYLICIFWITVFYHVWLLKVFFSWFVTAHSLDSVFHRAKVFNFNEVQFINYFLMHHVFGVISKKSLPYQWSSRFTLTLRSFIILHFTFRSIIHFRLIFMKC